MLSLCFAVPNEDTNLTAVDLSSSIYAPLLGATEGYYTKDETDTFQSTHPLRGATVLLRPLTGRVVNFNPRTPCGVRRPRVTLPSLPTKFQSTHPVRGATRCVRIMGTITIKMTARKDTKT